MTEDQLMCRLRELAESARDARPSVDTEARVLRVFADQWRAGRIGTTARVSWTLAAAATVLIGVTGALLVVLARPPAPDGDHSQPISDNAPLSALDDFVPVPDAVWLPQLESARIVRYELPIAALPAYGVPVNPDAVRGAVTADLLIGQDGRARAIRVIVDDALQRSFP